MPKGPARGESNLTDCRPAGCSNSSAGWGGRGRDAITASGFDAHLRFMASDLVEGRGPGSRGAEATALYVATQFELAGLRPLVGDSSFLQPVPLAAVMFLAFEQIDKILPAI